VSSSAVCIFNHFLASGKIKVMNIGKLKFNSISESPDLLADPTRKYLATLENVSPTDIAVAEIDPLYAGGEELCAYYDVDPSIGGNCIVVEAKRADRRWYAACLVPTGSRIDLNGFVRKYLNARRVSLAPKDEAIRLTNMEYGSINAVGLPKEWMVLIDASLVEKPMVIMGSGLVKSKLAIPGSLLKNLPNTEVVEGLGI